MVRSPGLIEDPRASSRGVAAFFVAAALGMGFIVLAKVSGFSQLAVTAVPIGILFVYAVILFRWRRLTLRDDQAGDSLYYLGFLYTLTSIAVSLYQFSLSESGQEQIITNFGIAIATTIVGLALRVMFNQMRQDPAEVERVSRLELADASRRLRREIDSVVMELNVFQRTAQQSAIDNQRTLQDRVASTLQTSYASFGESVSELAGRIGELTKAVGTADEALDDFEEHLDELRTPELLGEIKALVEEVRKSRAEEADRLNAAAISMDRAANTMRDAGMTMLELARKRERAAGEMRGLWTRAAAWLGRDG
jgi:hypothetical protein